MSSMAILLRKSGEPCIAPSIGNRPVFPASNKVMRQKITIPKSINLTPQETEQLSEYVSDDSYVQRQKEDIQELTSMFRGMLDNNGADGERISQ